jgi:hypothetical protein
VISLKRWITYLYDYESGTKGKATGFIRVDQRGSEIRMEVHVRGAKHMQGNGKLFLIAGKTPVVGIYMGDVTLIRGEGDGVFQFAAYNICNSGMDFSDVIGVAIRNSEGYLASNWKDESCSQLLKGTFQIMEQETQPEDLAVAQQATTCEQVLEKTMSNVSVCEEEIGSDIQVSEEIISEEKATEDINLPIFPKPTYRKIQLSHIQSLPTQNRHLGNNNFLRHGFFNYNYLIIKKEMTSEGEQWSLGVPGVYEQPEKMMATMFGFLRFEARQEGEGNPEEGTFGAWYTPLQM